MMNKRTLLGSVVATVGLTSLLISSAFVGTPAEAKPHHQTFTDWDFMGSYGILERGWLAGMNWSEVGIITVDGRGHGNIEFIGTLGGTTSVTAHLTCNYEVYANGLGTMDCIQDENGEETTVHFVLVDRGREMRFTTAPLENGGQAMGTARRQ